MDFEDYYAQDITQWVSQLPVDYKLRWSQYPVFLLAILLPSIKIMDGISEIVSCHFS